MAKQGKNKAITMPAGIGIGVGAALVITLIGAVVLTFLLAGERLTVEKMGYGIMAVVFISAFFGCLVSTRCFQQRKLIVSLITAAAYLLALMAVNAIFFDGQYEGVGGTLPVVAIAGTAAAFTGSGGGKNAKGRKKFRLNGKIAQ